MPFDKSEFNSISQIRQYHSGKRIDWCVVIFHYIDNKIYSGWSVKMRKIRAIKNENGVNINELKLR